MEKIEKKMRSSKGNGFHGICLCFVMAIIFKILVSCLHRIVARVDQLMSLCNKLEAGLMHSQADSEKLMEAVVGRMLAG